jgi:hypothetical protein
VRGKETVYRSMDQLTQDLLPQGRRPQGSPVEDSVELGHRLAANSLSLIERALSPAPRAEPAPSGVRRKRAASSTPRRRGPRPT